MDELVTHLLEVSRGGSPAREPRARRPDRRAHASSCCAARPIARGASLTHVPGSRAARFTSTRSGSSARSTTSCATRSRRSAAGGHVVVTTRDDPHSTVIVVDDDGPGIPPADRAALFELFFTRKRGGTGLGLPLAQRAIHDHGGELEVLDRPGGGARFVVHLPVAGDAATPGRRDRAEAS